MNNQLNILFSCLILFSAYGELSAQGQFFWSDKDLGEGAVVGDFELFLDTSEPSKEVFLYYDAQGQDIGTGIDLDFSFAELGIVKYIAGETFEFDIIVSGVPTEVRWGDFTGESFITDNEVNNFFAFNIFSGEGLRAGNTGAGNRLDTGFDASSGAFKIGSVTIESVQTGITQLTVTQATVVNDTFPISPEFLNLTINSIVECLEPSLNDNWDSSIEILASELPSTLLGLSHTNVEATTQPDEQQLDNTGSTVWYNLTADENGTLTVSTFGSDFDTQLHIYSGFDAGFENLVPVVDNNDDGSELTSRVEFEVEAGERYEIRVGGFRTSQSGTADEGCIRLQVEFESADILGDVNCDGIVNLLDVSPFVDLVVSGEFNSKADIDENGEVNLLDVAPFVAILTSG